MSVDASAFALPPPKFAVAAAGAPEASVVNVACATDGWFRSCATYVAFGWNVSGNTLSSSQPAVIVVNRLTPGPVSWNCGKPRHAVISVGLEGNGSVPNCSGVRTSTW